MNELKIDLSKDADWLQKHRKKQQFKGGKEMPTKTEKRVTMKKYQGDDLYSWAVFVDGRPVITGLSRHIASYERKQVIKKLNTK